MEERLSFEKFSTRFSQKCNRNVQSHSSVFVVKNNNIIVTNFSMICKAKLAKLLKNTQM